MKKLLPITAFLFVCRLHGQQAKVTDNIAAGNDFYKKGEFAKAVSEYNKALQAAPGNTTAKFNQANTLYKQDQKVEAVQVYTALSREAADKDLKAKSFYNKGVILSQQKNLEESIEAYKNALRNNPDDKEARENLQMALLELRKKTPPPKKEKKENKKQDQQQQKQPQSRMSPKETEQRLKLLQQKEKEVQQRIQQEKSKSGGAQPKDW